ncbi:hypothetical protein OF83DRAFT_354614 [Amylostereum chailletii]|nr:hypothetical protein OF83DRAFT_354614 [Amylostereum chailletii]
MHSSLPYPLRITPEHLRTTDPRRRQSASSVTLPVAPPPSRESSPSRKNISPSVQRRASMEPKTEQRWPHTKRKRGQSSHFPWHHHTTQTAISATVPSSPIFPTSSLSSSSWDPFAIQDVLAVAVIRSATRNEQELRQAYAELESRLQELSEKYEVEVREREALVVRSDAAMVREEALKAEVGALTSDNERKGRSEREEMRMKVDNLSAAVVACQKQQESFERQRADDQSEVKRLKDASAKSQTARLKIVQSIREYRDREQGTRRRLKEVVGGVTKNSDPRVLADIVVKRLRAMDDRLDIEKNARRKAEAQAEETKLMLDKVEQECREAFMVPALSSVLWEVT